MRSGLVERRRDKKAVVDVPLRSSGSLAEAAGEVAVCICIIVAKASLIEASVCSLPNHDSTAFSRCMAFAACHSLDVRINSHSVSFFTFSWPIHILLRSFII
jgi:hypothetical protein